MSTLKNELRQFLNESPKNKKSSVSADQKKQRKKLLTWLGTLIQIKKVNEGIEDGEESSQKILDVMSKQFKSK